MSDFLCLNFVDVIPITRVGLVGTKLDIEGSDVSAVTHIKVNGETVTDFAVLSKTRVMATIPLGQRNSTITSVSLAGKSGKAAIITFKAKSVEKMTDSLYVVQRYLKCLLTTPGSDIFNPSYGIGLQDLVGSDFSNVEFVISSAIREAERQIILNQSAYASESKTLVSVSVEDARYNINELTVSVRLRFEMLDGSSVETKLNTTGY